MPWFPWQAASASFALRMHWGYAAVVGATSNGAVPTGTEIALDGR
ncbi:MAG: hypothetical protein ABEL51_06540 [Salinibacter sp.]